MVVDLLGVLATGDDAAQEGEKQPGQGRQMKKKSIILSVRKRKYIERDLGDGLLFPRRRDGNACEAEERMRPLLTALSEIRDCRIQEITEFSQISRELEVKGKIEVVEVKQRWVGLEELSTL